jgi:hypothetical protein
MKLRWRIFGTFGLYLLLVSIACIAFRLMSSGVHVESPIRYAYVLCGPALALYTHASYALFLLVTLFIFPWMYGLVFPSIFGPTFETIARVPSGFLFCATWLTVGWYLHDLF